MNRRGLLNGRSNLGESTSCLLTFQHDMLEQGVDSDFKKMTMASAVNPKPPSVGRGSDHEMTHARSGMAKASANSRNSDDSDQKTGNSTSSSTAYPLRRDDAPKPVPRTKSGSKGKITEAKLSRSASTASPRKSHQDNSSMSPTSVSSVVEHTIQPRSCDKPKEYHRPRPPPGRSRPAIRTHRSGSFALRQFKENYDQTHNRRSKTKAEAQSRQSMINESMKPPPALVDASETSPEWVKPPLRPYRSADGSFRYLGDIQLANSFVDTGSDVDDSTVEVTRGPDQRGKEFKGGTKFERTMVEVAPGCSVLMCGINETMNALHLDRIIHAECTSCNTFLASINVASMVLCPGCQTISPLESSGYSYDCVPIMGMGLRVEDILAHVDN